MHLTPRQKDVLERIVQGHTAKEIARSLHIGIRTVEAAYRNLREKARARNAAHLAALAVQHGWYSGKIKRMEMEEQLDVAASPKSHSCHKSAGYEKGPA